VAGYFSSGTPRLFDLIIESAPDGEASFYFCDNETGDETEALLGDRSDVLTAAFVKLGLRS